MLAAQLATSEEEGCADLKEAGARARPVQERRRRARLRGSDQRGRAARAMRLAAKVAGRRCLIARNQQLATLANDTHCAIAAGQDGAAWMVGVQADQAPGLRAFMPRARTLAIRLSVSLDVRKAEAVDRRAVDGVGPRRHGGVGQRDEPLPGDRERSHEREAAHARAQPRQDADLP